MQGIRTIPLVEMPFQFQIGPSGYGVLRLRSTIRVANRATALRMTIRSELLRPLAGAQLVGISSLRHLMLRLRVRCEDRAQPHR